ncbi:DsbC family protein [Aromatoleum aromaticum]|uniref:Thiol:disulfide interchange protein n=1 Tax=Aromatoleum aromaticum (strain DSM 19018 / LMG 30748 / EbN1) TaxID=76114 RepID=Q5P2L9_AROAE|nr:DsbC family protein [Aromatoleum aromaticum]NMG56364.1 thioredoxin fold domain-containing protein [Aromatoleum aromaticum]CAI08445.1 putative thiol:disulphide interchange protein (Periplasmic) [Aromatoleum aromaticum EbN1]
MVERALRPVLVTAFVGMTSLGLAHADEGSVRKAVEGFVGSPVVESVARIPYGELYEVVLKSGEIVYTDEKMSFLIDGRVIDTSTRRDITQARMAQLSAIDVGTLPLDQAIKQVRGNGKRVIVSFEDPNCAYCKRLGKELAQLKDVTVYTFLYPILSPDSTEKSRNIWCADDRAKAWSDWILNAKVPASASCDSSVVERNVTLGQKLKINGTPTMFLADGRRLGGYLPAAELEQALLEAGKK